MSQYVYRVIEAAESRLDAAYRRLSDAERFLASAEEPEDYHYHEVRVAREEVERAQRRLSDVQTAAQSFEKARDEFRLKLDRTTLSGQIYLDERISAARNYLSLSVSDSGARTKESNLIASGSSTPKAIGSERALSSVVLKNAGRDELPVLPRNLQWVSVDEVDWSEAPSDLGFRKVSREKIVQMLRTFERDLLPVLAQTPDITPSRLAEMDRQLGRVPTTDGVRSDSLEFCFGYLIGTVRESDLIVMDVMKSEVGRRYGFTSGRHRALVAKELGWKFIPARVIGKG